ncbi:hypothetical protein LCGC14_0475850 [marine sediment metagenome]|uniref:Uncharacterized protein n=1 Tax=marine sediment metagenome TaxID=412755 RepID=A0A0F9VJI3_9ZZZZ
MFVYGEEKTPNKWRYNKALWRAATAFFESYNKVRLQRIRGIADNTAAVSEEILECNSLPRMKHHADVLVKGLDSGRIMYPKSYIEEIIVVSRGRFGRLYAEMVGGVGELEKISEDIICATPVTVRSIYEDLVSLADEFGVMQVRKDHSGIIVILRTDNIVFEEIELGRFDICIAAHSGLVGVVGLHYCIEECEGNWSGGDSDDGVCHPHVSDGQLCEGNAKVAIQTAIRNMDIFNLAILVKVVMETYYPSGAYIKMDEWGEGGESCSCAACGDRVPNGESYYCEHCSENYCGNCAFCCEICSNSTCYGIGVICEQCGTTVCKHCIKECAEVGCMEEMCTTCVGDHFVEGYCPDCFYECSVCGGRFGDNENMAKCENCSETVCNDCVVEGVYKEDESEVTWCKPCIAEDDDAVNYNFEDDTNE